MMSDDALVGREKDAKRARELRLQYAAENRRNEIELLWKRAGYFFAFLTVLGVAFSTAFTTNHRTVAFLVCCYGFLVSICWTLVNRSSKYWQTVWEKKVEQVEEPVLQANIFARESNPLVTSRWFWGPKQFSPSKLVIALSDVTVCGWFLLGCGLQLSRLIDIPSSPVVVGGINAVLGVGTLVAAVLIGLWGRSGNPMKRWQAWCHLRVVPHRIGRWIQVRLHVP